MYQTLSADGNSNVHTTSDSPHYHAYIHVHLSGDFGSGTAKVQFQSQDGSTWLDVAGGSFTSATDTIFDMRPNTALRVNLNGSTSPSLVVEIK